ncbi:MAG TPA: acetolactate synthase large subunit [Myxococcota bacterium]|jgi:acetolactate synthase-1/2/3 large subunit
MNGAEALIETARRGGVEVCFANPGTTEMPLVAALDKTPGVRAVLGLFEGVCSGAADGYARMTGRPAATLLHLGPGFANGLANLHNARRARVPLINWIGDQTTGHLAYDAPLTSQISLLTEWSGWTRSVKSAGEMAEASAASVAAALSHPARIASLILPADCQWNAAPAALTPAKRAPVPSASPERVREAARVLRAGGGFLLLGGDALGERGLRAAARVAAASGASVLVETFPARMERGRPLPSFAGLPYFPDQGRAALAGARAIVLAGAREPVGFFGYPNEASRLAPPDAALVALADPDAGSDATAALEALADELGAAARLESPERKAEAFAPSGAKLDLNNLGRALASLQPEHAIVVNEAATSGLPWNATFAPNAAPHTMLSLSGGAIGQGLPNALGAAIACPERRVIAFQADGSGLYTLQALWSMARESANVTVVVCANRKYRILQAELARAGVAEPGPKARDLTDLSRPVIDWVSLARGFGVPGVSVARDSELVDALKRAFAEPGPRLIEAVLG